MVSHVRETSFADRFERVPQRAKQSQRGIRIDRFIAVLVARVDENHGIVVMVSTGVNLGPYETGGGHLLFQYVDNRINRLFIDAI